MRGRIEDEESNNPLLQEDDLDLLLKEVETQCEIYLKTNEMNLKRSAQISEDHETEAKRIRLV